MRTALFGTLVAACLAAVPLTSKPANALALTAPAVMAAAADALSETQKVTYGYGWGYRPWRPYYRPAYYGYAVAAVLSVCILRLPAVAAVLRLLSSVLSASVLRLQAMAAVLPASLYRAALLWRLGLSPLGLVKSLTMSNVEAGASPPLIFRLEEASGQPPFSSPSSPIRSTETTFSSSAVLNTITP